jgi:cell division protein FtsZ
MFEVVSDNQPRETVIKVIGVGGGGGNAVEHMIERGAQGIEFIAINTDYTALSHSRAHATLQIGKTGLGAGAQPEVGESAAIEAKDRIVELLKGANLVFITAGMGGGTGTGAAPIVAQIAREMGILTVAVVTKPFSFEGPLRMQRAEEGLVKLKEAVDCQIVILNDKLEDELGEDASMSECFAAADDVLFKACAGISEIIKTPGLIGLDFEDLRTVMSARGTAMMGSAIASGPDRARLAAEQAVACPLLEGVTLNGARGVLVYITASEESMKMKETKTVMNLITNFTAKGAKVIYGTAYDDSMGDSMRVTVVATGLDNGLDQGVPALEKKEEPQRVIFTPNPAPKMDQPDVLTDWGPRNRGVASSAQQSAAASEPSVLQPQQNAPVDFSLNSAEQAQPATAQESQAPAEMQTSWHSQEIEKSGDGVWDSPRRKTGWWDQRKDNK